MVYTVGCVIDPHPTLSDLTVLSEISKVCYSAPASGPPRRDCTWLCRSSGSIHWVEGINFLHFYLWRNSGKKAYEFLKVLLGHITEKWKRIDKLNRCCWGRADNIPLPSVLVCWGCYNRSWAGWFKWRTFIFLKFWTVEVQDQNVIWVGFCWSPSLWPVADHLFLPLCILFLCVCPCANKDNSLSELGPTQWPH